MSYGWTYTSDPIEIKFIKAYLFVVGKSTKKRMEFWWRLSPYWNGKQFTSTLYHSLKELRDSGVVVTDKTNKEYEFSLI